MATEELLATVKPNKILQYQLMRVNSEDEIWYEVIEINFKERRRKAFDFDTLPEAWNHIGATLETQQAVSEIASHQRR